MKYWPACFLLLAGCGDRAAAPVAAAGNDQAPAALTAPQAETVDVQVDCATGGAATFARICTRERSDSPAGRVMTLRAPDGGFRRLLITRDGRGVVAADGAEPARVAILSPARIEVAVGQDRYRLPAAIRQ
jgi:hypothetical protein